MAARAAKGAWRMQQTVFVIDDDDAMRESLIFLLRSEGVPSRAFASAQAFLDQLHDDHRGCVITDIRMPGMDGLALVAAMASRRWVLPIIVITGHGDVPLAVQAMKAGVTDFIEKPFESDAILGAVRRALEIEVSQRTVDSYRETVKSRIEALTQRERQVLHLVADGLANKEIGQVLNISWRTVETYRAGVMHKMKADSLSDLVRMVISQTAG
jgi:two-component system response regulator FixJ